MTTLRSLTVPLGVPSAAIGLLEYLVRDDQLCWVRHGEGLVGFGETLRHTATGPERFASARSWWNTVSAAADVQDEVQVPGTGLAAFGSFAFSKRSPFLSRVVVPEIVVGSRNGTAWATLTTLDPDAVLDRESVAAALAGYLEEISADSLSLGSDAILPGMLSESEWKNAVARSVAHIAAGELSKIVLARDIVASLSSPIATAQVLRELALRYASCWTYSVDGLIGSTPEMLIKVEDGKARARVLAGTLDRATAPLDDPGYAKRVLAGSEKQQHEHAIAIDSVTRQLEPFTSSMTSHSEPFVLELPNVWHLASDVTADLQPRDGALPTPLDLVEALHPTAAVCGYPTSVAGELISELEHMDRGPYAGPVGWFDAAGNGEWGIALRGAVIEEPQAVRLFAGCGIVSGSNPAAELEETWSKFRPMLEALGLDRARVLSGQPS
ncbi:MULTISPECIES: isochorismate synthase [Arthrobacter]|uniref:isochorismate synthase n=1 Tax=Arthrobacter caoxuetaonis TaxID=2886935 RepID=A0A9X1MCE0_9MICC|nr:MULTISPECIES: isochorismate synthase [Arthrobacter]MCC3281311.1 isochorismate synthase [Arthrobacter caoxuetaonis]MCC3296437.1 isochorismate synthase [Arthrobacter caoxuetaonis]MCC9192513.1 isochorismate synthase [Arthrobacter sp. zg-Y916]USQ56728.1 isochorismate synthase [Arthrobacter caoxuetaonis]